MHFLTVFCIRIKGSLRKYIFLFSRFCFIAYSISYLHILVIFILVSRTKIIQLIFFSIIFPSYLYICLEFKGIIIKTLQRSSTTELATTLLKLDQALGGKCKRKRTHLSITEKYKIVKLFNQKYPDSDSCKTGMFNYRYMEVSARWVEIRGAPIYWSNSGSAPI